MATALHVNGHDLPIDGQVLHVAPAWQTVYVLMATPDPATDANSIERAAHKALMNLDRQPLFDGGRVVESFIMPATQNFFGHVVPGGTWIVGLRFDDADWPKVVAQLDGDAQNIAHKGGGDSMDRTEETVAFKTFSDAVRGIVPEKPATVDAELVLVRQIVNEALKPLLFTLEALDSRVRRIVTGLGQPPNEDPFGAAVRGGPLTATEQLAQKRRAERDPFGAAVREVRPTLIVGHRFLRNKRR